MSYIPPKINNPLKQFRVFFDEEGEGSWIEKNREFLGGNHPLIVFAGKVVYVIKELRIYESRAAQQNNSANFLLLKKLIELAVSYNDEQLYLPNEYHYLHSKIRKIYDKTDSFFKEFVNEFSELIVKSDVDVNSVREHMTEFVMSRITNKEIDEVGSAIATLFNYSRNIKLQQDYAVKLRELDDKLKEISKQKIELRTSEDWDKHFEDRANEIETEIDPNEKSKFSRFFGINGKIFWLRFFIYIVPFFSAFVCFLAIITEQKFNLIHYEFAISIIFLISILSYHLKQVLRELNILKHMRSSYLHRAVVAKTFQSLVVSDHFKNDKGDIVVKEAALAMFKKEAQGYLSKDQMEPSNTPLQEIVGIFKNKQC